MSAPSPLKTLLVSERVSTTRPAQRMPARRPLNHLPIIGCDQAQCQRKFMFKMFSSRALRIKKLCYPWVV